ncbi:MAG TPA: glycosyltransferase family 2 protein [Candidatus Atribacteria bacterium]|nr:glycosyltransferase family 2 protein [Candidatus Atribacteria bacterium]
MSVPFISIVIPVYNEEKNIGKCLDSLLNQNYPEDKYKIIVADGNSEDNTKKIVEKYTKKHSNIKILDNPERNTAVGRNIGIKNSKGDFILNFSGHAFAEKNLLSTLSKKLIDVDKSIAGVGCGFETITNNSISKGIHFVLTSKLGGFGTTFNHPEKECFMDSIAFTLYRREIFDEIGLFDPDFWIGQDGELNLRIKEKGYKLLYTPETKVYHAKRDSFSSYSNQMFKYGIAAYKRIKKHKNSKIIYLLPSLTIILLLFFLLLSLFHKIFLYFVLFYAFFYIIVSLAYSIKFTVKEKNPRYLFIILPLYITTHFCYGIGFLCGALK